MTVEEIIKATGGKLISENSKTFSGVSTDSRTITEGQLFIALRGDTYDGHNFLEKALVRGSGAMVDRMPESLPQGKVIVHVNDTLRSLQDMAHMLRINRDIPVVAVTGSNGKTTTKEMIYRILSGKFRTLKNEGNMNNHIGLPLSLLRLEPDDEMIVLEMGMNAAGEIRRLCEIAAPTHGVITNIGLAHVGRLGSREAVRRAKFEIVEGLHAAIVNADDEYLMDGFEKIEGFHGRIITFGMHNDADVTALNMKTTAGGCDFVLAVRNDGTAPVSLKVHGTFNVYNALAASAAASSLGMSIDEIAVSLGRYHAYPMRFEMMKKGSITVINDSYNANPSSIRESVRELFRMHAKGRAVIVLGDMGELGEFSDEEHRGIGRMISETAADLFVSVGRNMRLAAEECMNAGKERKAPEVVFYADVNEAVKNIGTILKKGDTVLIKGSRAMTMEKIAEGISGAL